MYVASLVGVDTPEIRMIELLRLDNLPQINYESHIEEAFRNYMQECYSVPNITF
jgi:hypothetical protein